MTIESTPTKRSAAEDKPAVTKVDAKPAPKVDAKSPLTPSVPNAPIDSKGKQQPQPGQKTYGTMKGAQQYDVKITATPARRDAKQFRRIGLISLAVCAGVVLAIIVPTARHSRSIRRGNPDPSPNDLDVELGMPSVGVTDGKDNTDAASNAKKEAPPAVEGSSSPVNGTLSVEQAPPVPAPQQDQAAGDLPHESDLWGHSCRDCTLDECQRLPCDHSLTPFACLGGNYSNGCAATPNKLHLPHTCTSCCSLKSCVSLAPKCGHCEPADCQRLSKTCGMKRPFVCLDGASVNGCSEEEEQWPKALFTKTCGRCCDLKTCPPLPGCGPCTEEMCGRVGTCASDQRYGCHDGPAVGGCAATEQFWKDGEASGVCNKCCDTSTCDGFRKAKEASEKRQKEVDAQAKQGGGASELLVGGQGQQH